MVISTPERAVALKEIFLRVGFGMIAVADVCDELCAEASGYLNSQTVEAFAAYVRWYAQKKPGGGKVLLWPFFFAGWNQEQDRDRI